MQLAVEVGHDRLVAECHHRFLSSRQASPEAPRELARDGSSASLSARPLRGLPPYRTSLRSVPKPPRGADLATDVPMRPAPIDFPLVHPVPHPPRSARFPPVRTLALCGLAPA